MTTLSALKTRISDDLARSDISSQIGDAISDAISYYVTSRFFFNETRLSSFSTVAGQSLYTSADDADIPLFVELDAVFLNDGSNERELALISPSEMQWLIDSSGSRGEPRSYSYFEQSFRLYPVPGAVYTVRPIGVIEKATPATDDEANNVWVTKAFELIRCRAKAYLAVHLLYDPELASIMAIAEQQALAKLRRETTKKAGTGRIAATCF